MLSASFDHLGKKPQKPMGRAVLLLSGGLDSYTAGAMAGADGYALYVERAGGKVDGDHVAITQQGD